MPETQNPEGGAGSRKLHVVEAGWGGGRGGAGGGAESGGGGGGGEKKERSRADAGPEKRPHLIFNQA